MFTGATSAGMWLHEGEGGGGAFKEGQAGVGGAKRGIGWGQRTGHVARQRDDVRVEASGEAIGRIRDLE
jgi:hypothetical protein